MTDTFEEESREQTPEDLGELVSEKIRETFESGREVYFLSRLGADLGKPVLQRIEKITGRRLAEFLRAHTAYKPQPSATDEKVFFVRPLEAEGAEPVRTGHGTRYVLSFWTAFFKPSEETERRFINVLDGTFRSEVDGQVEDEEKYIEIDSDLMPGPDEPDRDDTSLRISTWLIRHKLPNARFERSARKARKSRQNLLDEILAALSAEQQRRVVLPLDIVAALKGEHGAEGD